MNVFVLAILFYLLYRFVAGFLIPLVRTTHHVRQQFRNNMNGNGQNGQAPNAPGAGAPGANYSNGHDAKTGSSKVGEYIDFEEIK